MVTLVTLSMVKAGLTSHSDKELSPWAGDWRLCFTIWNDRFSTCPGDQPWHFL